MAQSATTVTPPNPTPPTNFSCVGASPPLDPLQAFVDDGITGTMMINENNPPSGVSASPQAFAVNTAAAGSGTSVAGEGRGTETVVTLAVPNPSPAGQLKTFSDLGNYTIAPNGQHASSLSPATNPALTSITPGSTVSGVGATTLGATGTNFTPQSKVVVNGVEQVTVYVSPTSLTCAAVTKKTTAGTWPVIVRTGGVVETAAQNWTFT